MSHSFSFLYRGIHKYKRRFSVFFLLNNQHNGRLFGDLFCRPFIVDSIDVWRHLTTSKTQFITTLLNDVLWRHLTASNTIYNTSFDVRYFGRLSVTCALDMEVVYYTFTVRQNAVRFGGRLLGRHVGRLYTVTNTQ